MRTSFLFTILPTVAAIAAACGGSTSTVSGPSADEACTDLTNAECSKVDSCASVLGKVVWGDTETCKKQIKGSCVKAVNAPSTGLTPALAAKCASSVGAVSCSDLLNGPPADCQPVAGLLVDGAACVDDSQCQTRYCSVGKGTSCGKCGAAPKEGDSCVAQHCAPGYDCKDDKCVKRGATGAECSDAKPCQVQLSCTGGKCGPPATNGQPCDVQAEAHRPATSWQGSSAFRRTRPRARPGPAERSTSPQRAAMAAATTARQAHSRCAPPMASARPRGRTSRERASPLRTKAAHARPPKMGRSARKDWHA